MSAFKVGDLLVGQNHLNDTHFNGMECLVIGGLEMRLGLLSSGRIHEAMGYRVQWADGQVTASRPANLRRKQPPAGEQSIIDMFKLPVPSKTMEPA